MYLRTFGICVVEYINLILGNLSQVEYLTGNFQNIHIIQVLVYVHHKFQKEAGSDFSNVCTIPGTKIA